MGSPKPPTVAVLAGINGAGKTTASHDILQRVLRLPVFVNADTIARGLNAFDVDSEAAKAGRIMLEHLRELAARGRSFAFETTLAGRAYASWLASLRPLGYEIQLFYYWLESPDLAIARVAGRVRAGGHNVPDDTVRRRYRLSAQNFVRLYRPLAEHWRVYDNSSGPSRLLAVGCGEREHVIDGDRWLDFVRSAADE
ncbi:MAG TPA: AAA family ATPase [Urbifossiella sp.]|jgi:predicted ABC-type ATPase|nr:AAA family ATPase [Urbifossiella sp.]